MTDPHDPRSRPADGGPARREDVVVEEGRTVELYGDAVDAVRAVVVKVRPDDPAVEFAGTREASRP